MLKLEKELQYSCFIAQRKDKFSGSLTNLSTEVQPSAIATGILLLGIMWTCLFHQRFSPTKHCAFFDISRKAFYLELIAEGDSLEKKMKDIYILSIKLEK